MKYKPCPFCGSTDLTYWTEDNCWHEIFCNNCGCSSGQRKAKEYAEKAWNKRVKVTK